MRQGLLSEPKASSGPAAMLLAVSRSPSSIPRRSPCPERCHLPLASLYTSTSQNLKNIPDCIHSRSDATFLWRPSTTSTHKISKTPPTASTPRPMPPSSGVPRPHPPNETSNVSPPASNAKSRRQKISRTDMRLRHSLSLAFRKKIKCIILIDKRIKTSASVYSKYHTKGGFYHGIQTFWKHDLSSS